MIAEYCSKLKCSLRKIGELGKMIKVQCEGVAEVFPYEEFLDVFQVFSEVFVQMNLGKLRMSDQVVFDIQELVCSPYVKPLNKLLALLLDLYSALQAENTQLSQFELNLTKSIKILQKTIKKNKLEKSSNSDSTNSTSTNSKESKTNGNTKFEPNKEFLAHSLKTTELHLASLISSTSLRVLSKISRFSIQLENCFSRFNKILNSDEFHILKKLRMNRKNFNFQSKFKASENFLILILARMLDAQHKFSSFPNIEINVLPSFAENCEELLLQNFQLKSEIAQYESDCVRFRTMENELRLAKEKSELLDKVNKELMLKKSDSDDSLDLGSCDIKGAIEIQELRAALHSITEKYEQDKEILIRDMIESRQDMETQLFRAQNEKNFIESKLKISEKAIQDLQREKERQDSQISVLKKDVDRLKDLQYSDNSGKALTLRRRSSEFNISPSFDFDISDSIKSNCTCEKMSKELNELLQLLHQTGQAQKPEFDWDIVRTSLKTLIKINEIAENEDKCNKTLELDLRISKQFESYKSKIKELEQKIQSFFSSDKKSEKMNKKPTRDLYVATEPSPRRSSPVNDSVNQLHLERSKLSDKKHEIFLHKEQIVALKKNIRDLQTELEKSRKFDMGYIKEMWVNFVKELSVQSSSIENLMEVFMKALGFNSTDVKVLQNERKSKKKGRFGIF